MQRAVLLDRDGTLVPDVPYRREAAGLTLVPGAAAALRAVQQAGYAVVVITNQSGIARGYFTAAELAAQHARLRVLLADEGVQLAGIYSCPHGPDAGCACRKPRPGMLHTAASELALDLPQSWMIGDKESDVRAGHAAGCRTILLAPPHETAATAAQHLSPDLPAALAWLLATDGAAGR